MTECGIIYFIFLKLFIEFFICRDLLRLLHGNSISPNMTVRAYISQFCPQLKDKLSGLDSLLLPVPPVTDVLLVAQAA